MDSCNLRVFEQEMPLYLRNKIHYYAASSLHFALLGNRYLEYTAQLPQGELGNYITARDVEMAKAVRVIAERMGLNLSSMAQRYLFSISEATRIVMGARNIQQIKHTITDWKEGALERSLFEEITAVLISTGSVFQDKFLKIA
jgi:aryl-alcohol dehydrogenase-like predicted oxidoreductase